MTTKPEGLNRLERACSLMNNTRTDAIVEWVGRSAVRLCDLSAEQWLRIYDAYHECGWDFTPDQWTDWQIKGALRGVVPQWDENERPIDQRTTKEVSAESRANAVARGSR